MQDLSGALWAVGTKASAHVLPLCLSWDFFLEFDMCKGMSPKCMLTCPPRVQPCHPECTQSRLRCPLLLSVRSLRLPLGESGTFEHRPALEISTGVFAGPSRRASVVLLCVLPACLSFQENLFCFLGGARPCPGAPGEAWRRASRLGGSSAHRLRRARQRSPCTPSSAAPRLCRVL